MADKKEGKGVARAPLKKRAEKTPEKVEKEEEEVSEAAGDAAEDQNEQTKPVQGAAGGEAEEFVVEPMELPPFEIIVGDRMNSFFFKFQYKNVEYSSGRNKTFLCFLVDRQGTEGLRGYLEDEHAGAHAEEAFFQQVLPEFDASLSYLVTWYVSSSPCAACAAKLVEILKARTSLRLTIFSSRLFMWEEPEVQAGMRALAAAGCKLRMMKPSDFVYTWDTFVENEEQSFEPWEDCQENYEYYQEKLADILQ